LPASTATLPLSLVWAGGILVLLSIATWRYRIWNRRLAHGTPLTDPRLIELLKEARETMGVRRKVTPVSVARLNSPAVFGFWRIRLALPEGLLNHLNESEWRMIFLHEMAHVRRHDPLMNLVVIALQFLHWFNPFIWLGLHRLRADGELVCDAMVLEHLGTEERIGYGRLLLNLLERFSSDPRPFAGAAPVVSGKPGIGRRILLIKRHRKAGLTATLATATLCAGLICITFTTASQPTAPATDSPAGAPAAEKTDPPTAVQPPTLLVTANAHGQPTVASTSLTLDELKARLVAALQKQPDLVLEIRDGGGPSAEGWVHLMESIGESKVDRIRFLTPIDEARRTAARSLYGLAMRHFMVNEYLQELADLNLALALDPNHREALFSRACLYGGELPMDQRDEARAVADYTHLLELDPLYCSARYNRGLALERVGEPDKAIADLTRVIKRDADFSRIGEAPEKIIANALCHRGLIYRGVKRDYARAVVDFSEAMRLDPECVDYRRILLRRGQTYQALKQYAKAQADYERYREIDPHYFELWWCWAWQLATAEDPRFRDGAKAVEYASKVSYPDIQAAAYAEKGDFAKAVELQRKAIADRGERVRPGMLEAYDFAPDTREAMQKRLELYESGRPYHGQ
jgi:beta-lactamase regulating signal transducer with metallopeptidase domain/tetratricopeptide (TPR) repeat protein